MSNTVNTSGFQKEITELVRQALATNEESEKATRVENLLKAAEDTVRDLTGTIQDKETEIASSLEKNEELLAKAEELKAKVAELEEKVKELGIGNEELKNRAVAAEQELAEIEASRRLEARMLELDTAKVSKSGEKRGAQASRIKEMSDEEFASYKEELVELRKEIEAEIAKEVAAEAAAGEVEVSDEEVSSADVQAAIEENKAEVAAAQLNVELASQDDFNKRYADLGRAMASKIAAEEK